MELQIYLPKRIRNGKRVVSRMYSGRLRLAGESKARQIALKTSDKTVALAKLEKIREELELEKAGRIAPKAQRDALQKPLASFLSQFTELRDKEGLSDKYITSDESNLRKMFLACKWDTFEKVTRLSFEQWRCNEKQSNKTLNEKLNSAQVFFKWLVAMEFTATNPLEKVKRLPKKPVKRFRAFTPEEFGKLASHPKRGIIYHTGGHTGGRRNELRQLEWRDVVLDGERPCVILREEITKNGKAVSIPLTSDLRASLRKYRPSDAKAFDLVFPDGIPEMDTFRKDLAEAGIPYQDDQGRFADFHSLRRTFNTLLVSSGATMRETMELMRHTDANLSQKTYMDVAQLPLAQVMENLKLVNGDDARRDARDTLKYGEIPPLTAEILETLGTEFLWPASRDPVEFVKAFLLLRPPNQSEENWEEPCEPTGVPVRNRT